MTVRSWRVTCLVDDQPARPGLPTEHGLALHVDADGRSGLLDTGRTALVVGNARRLGLELGRVGWVVLSHGHYDHTGGLEAVLGASPDAVVHAHPDAFGRKGVEHEHASYEIGAPVGVGELRELGVDLRLERGPREVAPGILCTGEVPRTTGFEAPEHRFWVRDDAGQRPDPFDDDQALVLDTSDGLVVLLGCSHRGVINTLRRAVALLPGRRLHLVVGGMHLYAADDERIERTADALLALDVDRVGCCHCTGDVATSVIRDRLGARYIEAGVGATFEGGRT